MKSEINKDYIRGFFDGEGCVSRVSKNSIIVTIANTNLEILEKIKFFLDRLSIHCKIVIVTPSLKSTKSCYIIRITGIWNTYRFWKFIGSNHQDKINRFVIIFKKNEKLRRHLLCKRIKKWAKEGISYSEISKRTKISKSSICHIIRNTYYIK